jgi:hypothetical protein
VPSPSQAFTATKVTWEYAPLTIQYLANACQVGFDFLEVPDPAAAPSYTVNDTCLRFPSSTLKTALLSQIQQIIPLIHIRVREGATAPAWDSGTAYTAGQVVNYSSTPYVSSHRLVATITASTVPVKHNRACRQIFEADRRVGIPSGKLHFGPDIRNAVLWALWPIWNTSPSSKRRSGLSTLASGLVLEAGTFGEMKTLKFDQI